ncbi:MAG: DUF4265 domain-containing protein [Planctomycetaceae bacterium]|nr:DUF4265 domain-containing protein [Planctomycetaceae bacterium]
MIQQKVLFRLERDAEGFPPADVEGVWADEAGEGKFVLDNIPFFARQATLGDVVSVNRIGDELFYDSTEQPSGNSLVRVVMFGGRDPQELRSRLRAIGCSSELSHLPSLFAVNVPPSVDIGQVRALLDEGSALDQWDYEEAILRK